jgi:hypothetical protein
MQGQWWVWYHLGAVVVVVRMTLGNVVVMVVVTMTLGNVVVMAAHWTAVTGMA